MIVCTYVYVCVYMYIYTLYYTMYYIIHCVNLFVCSHLPGWLELDCCARGWNILIYRNHRASMQFCPKMSKSAILHPMYRQVRDRLASWLLQPIPSRCFVRQRLGVVWEWWNGDAQLGKKYTFLWFARFGIFIEFQFVIWYWRDPMRFL